MAQRILFALIFILSLSFFIFLFQKFLPLYKASLIDSSLADLTLKLDQISKELDELSLKIESLILKIENSKIDLSPISKEISKLKAEIQKTKREIPKNEEDVFSLKTQETEAEKIEKEIKEETEIKKEPQIFISFPKEVFPNEEFYVFVSVSNLENKKYDLKISVEFEEKILSQIFNQKEKRWQSSHFYIGKAFEGSSFSGTFKLKIISENIFGDVEIFAKVRDSETQNLIISTSEKIRIKQIEISTFQPPSQTESECIDINTASLEDLDRIYGVGPTIAQRIIEQRPFSSVDDLIRVKGIGEKTLEKIKEQGLACVR
jgi:competence ComEA-like helix-hairpin-helix protein